jgi:hypothetical protein
MKRFFVLLLVSLFLFNSFGYYFIFTYNRCMIRREMRCLIRANYFEHSCTTLQISDPQTDPDFKKLNKTEFRYKGILYDIISEQVSGNSVIYRCIIDKQEEKLISGFYRSQEFANRQNNPARTRHAAAMLYHVITMALIETPLTPPAQYPKEIRFIKPVYPLSSILHLPSSPPPELS